MDFSQAIKKLIDDETPSINNLSRSIPSNEDATTIQIKSEVIQTLPIPEIWNWDTNPMGSITKAQFEFCDSMPSSALPGEFNPSGNSFSNNYSDFLSLLNKDTFIPKSILINYIDVNKPPTEAISSPLQPKGWTRVPNAAQVLSWKGLWGVSMSPSDWLGNIAANSQNVPLHLVFDSTSASVVLSNSENITVPKDQIEKVTITASVWGRITVNPGDWFGSTVISLAKGNESVFLKPSFLNIALGPNGSIKSRISEFIVAYMPSASITINSEFARSNNIIENSINKLSIAGFNYNKSSSHEILKDMNGASINLETNTCNTLQLAARTSTSHENKAYIIAVILKEY
ncbi:hypothetical protein [Psychroserpens sp. Hel_I_66]|uniref:hypothetical protein n=1 Tax=Psychroserpens sp. Hel_I_66 TaxID=1250004 RepID=UPI00064682F9|nr:hypothetical protein [Psychroserpens sp. Hel_I_66]